MTFEERVQEKAEERLAACNEALWWEQEREGEPPESPATAPFCGCDTCIVREVLSATWKEFETEANAKAKPVIEEMERIARARELGQYHTLGADDLRRWAEALRA
jgi:hypothetical protein